MGKTLRRYLVREIGAAFVAGLAILTFVLLVARILEMVDLVLARGVPATKILALFAYVLPSFLELTIPAALLLAIVVAFGRLTSDGEITAMLAAGIQLWQSHAAGTYVEWYYPFLLIALIGGGRVLPRRNGTVAE